MNQRQRRPWIHFLSHSGKKQREPKTGQKRRRKSENGAGMTRSKNENPTNQKYSRKKKLTEGKREHGGNKKNNDRKKKKKKVPHAQYYVLFNVLCVTCCVSRIKFMCQQFINNKARKKESGRNWNSRAADGQSRKTQKNRWSNQQKFWTGKKTTLSHKPFVAHWHIHVDHFPVRAGPLSSRLCFFVPPPPLHLFHIVYYFFGPSSTRTHLFACLVVKRRGNSLNIIPRTDKQINANNLVAWCADTAHQAQLDLNSPQTSFFPTFLMLIDFEKSYRQYWTNREQRDSRSCLFACGRMWKSRPSCIDTISSHKFRHVSHIMDTKSDRKYLFVLEKHWRLAVQLDAHNLAVVVESTN